ncbi:MAG: NAD(P)H-binding protein [Bacteroidales bacterium]
MKILVIGASGMLAKPVVKKSDENGFQVRLFSRTIDQSMYSKDYELVKGDLFHREDLEKALEGCDAIHINLSKTDEGKAVIAIVDVAKQKNIKIISYISGASVSTENRLFEMIDQKFIAEQTIITSGISYMIFRPSWFFESLQLMVRDGKAMMIGKQPNPSHWIAADDYAQMVATAYQKPEAKNKIFYVYGPEQHVMKDLLTKYCAEIHPEIKKVSSIPIGMMKLIAFLSRNKELKMVASLFAYFEKVKEPNADKAKVTNNLLGKAQTTFDQWLKTQKQ